MIQDLQGVTLETLANGAPAALFQRAMDDVLRDIDDPNTAATTARRITIELAIKPSASREAADVRLAVKVKLAGVEPVDATLILGRSGGRLVALQNDPRQEEMFKVVPMTGQKGATDGPNA